MRHAPDSRNFSHLAEFDPPLAVLAAHAERYFVDDANTALIKTRQFAERMAAVVAERAGIALEVEDTFADILRKIRSDGVAPQEVLDVLHRLRKDGNAAVHGHEGERRLAFHSIKLCHRLGAWLRATITGKPGLKMAFVPPKASERDSEDLKRELQELRDELSRRSSEAERHAHEAEFARQAALDAEARARLAEEERQIFEQLAEEAERRATEPAVNVERAHTFVRSALESAREIDFDEADTRLLVDEQLRQAGWDVDSTALRHSAGARPERNRNMAIAEWPTKSGPADYALFVGRTLVGIVEAKRKRRNVSSALDVQASRYSKDIRPNAGR